MESGTLHSKYPFDPETMSSARDSLNWKAALLANHNVVLHNNLIRSRQWGGTPLQIATTKPATSTRHRKKSTQHTALPPQLSSSPYVF